MSSELIDFSQISLYNTQRVTDEQSRQLFVARKKLLNVILNSILSTKRNAPPKHQLIIGQRGMGKTTLLKRLEVELRTQPDYKGFIPLLFPEEQYNLDSLNTFWLNCIDAIADMMEVEGKVELAKEIDNEVNHLSTLTHEEREKNVFMYFNHLVFNLGRRPVLLIDNINFVLGRLNSDEQHVLRSYLTDSGAAIIIGASSSQIDDINTYNAPFYDAFQVHYLRRLSGLELMDILNNLATVTGQSRLKKAIKKNGSRIKAINQLTGGNPRTAVILFKQIIKGFSDDITQELEGILDAQTPLYKARFEELPEKMQIIVNSIAMQWDPVTLEQIRESTQMENGQISPQLKRLSDFGWIERPKSARGKGGTYEISERMFNIWFLMRLSSRRQKKMVSCLSKFMEAFYEQGSEMAGLLKRIMITQFTDEKHAVTALALAKLTEDKKVRWALHEKTRQYIINHPESSDCFELKDLYDGAEEHANALNEAIKNDNAPAIVYTLRPLFDSGNNDCAPILANALIKTNDFTGAGEVIAHIQEAELKYYLLLDLTIAIHDNESYSSPLIEKYCLDAIRCGQNDSDGYFYYAKYLIENGRLPEAQTILQEAETVFPKDKRIQSVIGEVFYNMGEHEKAEELFSSLITDEEGISNSARFYLGTIRYSQKRFSEAAELFAQVQDDATNIPIAKYWLIPTLLMEGKTTDSRNLFMETLKVVNEPDGFAELISRILHAEGKYEVSEEYLNHIIKRWPEDVVLHYYMAECLYFQDEFTEAAKHLDPYLQKYSKDANALLLRGMIAWQTDDNLELAISFIRKSAELEETEGKYHLLGILARGMSNFENAASNFSKAISINPHFIPSMIALSEIYEYKLNQLEQAQKLAEEAYRINAKENPYRLVNLYRDGLFNSIRAEEQMKTISADCHSNEWEAIHHILSAILKKDSSIAERELRSFFTTIDTENMERETLCYLYAKCIEFGFGQNVLSILRENGMNETATPEYYAIQSILSGDPASFLDTVAKEAREVGLSIARDIQFYIRK